MANPFKPTFGVSPPLLVGRDALISDFTDALEDGPGAAGRASIYTGARGAGKTVMLNAVQNEARARGWIVVSETLTEGLVERLTQSRLPDVLQEMDPEAVARRMTGITGPLRTGGVTWTTVQKHVAKADLRSQINLLTDLLAEHGTGLLLTLDEIHAHEMGELRSLAAVVQHAFREDRELAFAGAGLSAAVSDVLRDDVLTFLRRADRHHLSSVDTDDVRRALEEPIDRSGRRVEKDALEAMADGTQGYPFMIQLVGARCWRIRPEADEINASDAEQGVRDARRRLGSLVHAPALAAASDIDKSYLLAMSKDDGPSKTADIGERLNVKKGYANVYRSRLIEADLIEVPGRGYVDFTLPYLRDYLREHAATLTAHS